MPPFQSDAPKKTLKKNFEQALSALSNQRQVKKRKVATQWLEMTHE